MNVVSLLSKIGIRARTATFSLLCFLIISDTSNSYASPAPELQAQLLAARSVNVTVKAVTGRKKRNSWVLVSRAIGQGNKFVNIVRVKVKGSINFKFEDQLTSDTTIVKYRSRLLGAASSGWSKPAALHLDSNSDNPDADAPVSDPAAPPVVQPTPVPTAVGSLPTPPKPEVSLPSGFKSCPRSEVQKVVELVNAQRAISSLAVITEIPSLALSSQRFSAKMAIASDMSHEGWFENIVDSGFNGSTAGQNIAYSSQLSGILVMSMWMNSPGHKANILSQGFGFLGVGCVVDPAGIAWWTQDFGG